MGEPPKPGIRISDAERDRAVAALWKHYQTGRLGPAEHEKRCALAAAAQSRAKIEVLFADLPAPHPDLSTAVLPVTRDTPPQDGEKLTVSHVLEGVGVLVLLSGTGLLVLLGEDRVEWWMIWLFVGVLLAIFALADLVKR